MEVSYQTLNLNYVIERVLLSTIVEVRQYLVFKKQKVIICTDKRIFLCTMSKSGYSIRFTDNYSDILGITKSLRIGARNFIIHFGTRADEEWTSDKRDELIDIVVTQYYTLEARSLNVYGLASAGLEDYLTSEKDLIRKVSRMPHTDYLISGNSDFLSKT